MSAAKDIELTEVADENPTRRDALRLLAGIGALATGLGVPMIALGEPAAARIIIKLYQGREDGGRLLNSVELPDNVSEYLASASGPRVQWKLYDNAARELGTLQVPAQVQEKIQAQRKAS